MTGASGTASPAADTFAAYRSGFARLQAEPGRREPAWLARLRREAFERFAARGFPTPREEAWRFTSVAPIARTVFQPAAADGVSERDLPPPTVGTCRAVVVNGRHVPELSSPRSPEGLRIGSLRDALAREPERLEPHLGRVALDAASAFTALNTSSFEDGLLVEIAPGAVVDQPIELVFFSKATGGAPAISHPRTLVLAGRDSQASLVETHAGDGGVYFANAVAEIRLAEGARLDHCTLQREGPAAFHVGALAADCGRGSRFADHAVALGASLARREIDVRLAGEGSECALNGLFLAGGEQHLDTHTRIEHARPHCASREVYKGILDGRARGVFHGTIRVERDAQKTDAYQVNKNLLLSREALVHSTPALEIYADDVKCKHGSTTGQLDASALFYLRSRGLDEAAARGLLTYAFASDVLGRLPWPGLRARLAADLEARLPGATGIREALA